MKDSKHGLDQHDHPHGHDHPHDHGHREQPDEHSHTHGVIDPSITASVRGIWAVKWSFVGLMVTALLQVGVVLVSGSVALLADTIHNFGDAATAIPLWIAFSLSRWKANKRFTYGYGRAEDFAGVVIVLIILFSALVAGYETVQRFLHPQPIGYLWAVALASIIGFIGNEAVAVFRIKVGKEIASAALVADGYHARTDGLTSLAVLFSAIGVWLGYPLADPLVGAIITVLIARIVWQSGKAVLIRALDGVDPHLVDKITEIARQARGVRSVKDVRGRWIGHRLHVELNVAVDSSSSVGEGHAVAKEVRHQLLHQLTYLSIVTIHIDPVEEAGEKFHHIFEHSHDGLAVHSH